MKLEQTSYFEIYLKHFCGDDHSRPMNADIKQKAVTVVMKIIKGSTAQRKSWKVKETDEIESSVVYIQLSNDKLHIFS